MTQNTAKDFSSESRSLGRAAPKHHTMENKIESAISERRKYLASIEAMLALLAEDGLTDGQEGYLEVIKESLGRIRLLDQLEAAEVSDTSRRVLVVDDDGVQQYFVKSILEKRGHKVTIAVNGADGFEKFRTGTYDIIFMDCQMPQIDGFQLTTAIRKLEQQSGAHTPIIAFTGHAVTGYKQRCFEVGMDDYILKPVSAADILARVEQGLISDQATK